MLVATKRFLWRWMKRIAVFVVGLITVYVIVILFGLIPVNNDFTPDEEGIEIFVVSNAVHADLVMPLNQMGVDWRQEFPAEFFPESTHNATHVAFGWGDAGFFIDTPTWSDFRISTAAYALWWASPTCMHVQMTTKESYENASSVKISKEQYSRLVEFVRASFDRKDSELICIRGASYGDDDAFFVGKGSYHGLNTCNSWVGRGLRTAGVRMAWMTPMPKTVTWYLPDE